MNSAQINPVIWIIDRQQWPRAALRAELLERGVEAVGFIELTDALAALKDPHSTKPQVIVLELFGLSPKQNEFDMLTSTGIPVLILCGAAELNDAPVRNHKWAAVLQRPFSIGDVVTAVDRLLARP